MTSPSAPTSGQIALVLGSAGLFLVGGFISVAYVHKYMDLNQTDLGHFIDQVYVARFTSFSTSGG